MAGANLSITITAQDAASAVFGKVSQGASSLGSKLGSAFAGIGAAGLAIGGIATLGTTIAGVATSMISGNAQMETYQTQLGTLMGSADAASERIKQLTKIGAETPFELTELVSAEKVMMGFGLTNEKTMKLAGMSLDQYRTSMGDMAAGSGTDLTEMTTLWAKFGAGATGESISRLQELGIVTREQLQEVGIQFSKSGELTSPLPEALAAAMKIGNAKFGGGMKALSATFEGQMSTLADNFNQAKTVMMAPIFDVLKGGLTSVNELLSSEGFQEGLKSFAEGFAAAVKTAINGVTALLDIFQGGDAFDVASEALDKIFPPSVTTAIVDGVALIGDAWRTLQQVIAGEWSPDASINPLVNAIGMIAVVIRDQVIPAVLVVAGFIVEELGVVVSWVSENMPLILATFQTVWGAVVTVVESVWPLLRNAFSAGLQIILGLVKTVMQIITGDWQGALDSLVGVAGTAWEAIKTQFGMALPAIGSLIDTATGGWLTTVTAWATTTVAAVTTWGSDTLSAVTGAMSAVSTAITNAWNAVKASVSEILPAIRTAILAIWNLLPEDLRKDLVLIAGHIVTQGGVWATNMTTAGTNMATNIATKLTDMVTAVKTWAESTFLAPLQALVLTAGTEGTNIGEGVRKGIADKLGTALTELGTWVTNFLAPITGLISTAGAEAGKIGSAIVDRIASAINGGLAAIRNAAYGAARAALDAAMSVLGVQSGGGGGGGGDGGGGGGDSIEERAMGGPVSRGRPYLVGERGPELFVPGGFGRIVPTPALQGAGGGGFGSGGAVNVTVNVNGSLMAQSDLRQVVGQAVSDQLRYGGRLGRG